MRLVLAGHRLVMFFHHALCQAVNFTTKHCNSFVGNNFGNLHFAILALLDLFSEFVMLRLCALGFGTPLCLLGSVRPPQLSM
jgi:hypothetical protein